MQILGIFDEIAFSIISGVFVMVAKVYDIMLGLVRNQGSFDMSGFDDFSATLYVLAGVFMLFRVSVGMIQMILNPDMMNDKQAGAGKLITRVVTSIILLLAFVPNGILFGANGLFSRMEKALLDDDGLVTRLAKFDGAEEQVSASDNSTKSDFLIENVHAAAKPDLTCYYYRVSKKELSKDVAQTGNGRTAYDLTINKIYKVYFYINASNTTGLTKITETANNSKVLYYKLETGRIGGANGPKYEDGSSVYYSTLGYPISLGSLYSDLTKCPNNIIFNNDSNIWVPNRNNNVNKNIDVGLHGGTTSLSGLKTAIKGIDGLSLAHYQIHIFSNNPFVLDSASTDDTLGNNPDAGEEAAKDLEGKIYLDGVNDDAVVFAQGTASSLQECVKDKKKECAKAQKDMFESSEANDRIVKLADSGDLELGFIVSMIAGLGLIVYLLLLCVEILVRRLKLFFLEVISPIPIISYVDPKDKNFNQWFKMYISTYVDLFIKLISISLAISLLKSIFVDFWETDGFLIKFFYIVAILVFAKVLPTMISKIFGLDSMGGSFKDIMGMAKGAAGFAAGAALGAGAGLITGAAAFGATKGQGFKNRLLAGAQGLGSGVSGALRGAGSGARGNVLGGARNVAGVNSNRRNQYNSGLRPTDLLAAATAGRVGMDYAARTDRRIQKDKDKLAKLNKFTPFKGDMENAAEDSKFMKTLRAAKANKQHNLSEEKMQDLRSAWIESQINGDESILRNALSEQFRTVQTREVDTGMVDINGNAITRTEEVEGLSWSYDDKIVEKGKQAAIVSTLNKANDLLADSKDISGAAGVSSVSSFAELSDANTNVKKAATSIDESIYRETTANTRYNVSQAARGASSDSDKK